LKLADLIF